MFKKVFMNSVVQKMGLLVFSTVFLFMPILWGCGDFSEGYYDDYSDSSYDSGESCEVLCDSVCDSCYSLYQDRYPCKLYCVPECYNRGCPSLTYSSTCDAMFQTACTKGGN